MKMRSFSLYVILIVLFSLSCQKSHILNIETNATLSEITIKTAKEWFIKTYSASFRTNDDKSVYKKVYWESAFEHYINKKQKIVVAPLSFL